MRSFVPKVAAVLAAIVAVGAVGRVHIAGIGKIHVLKGCLRKVNVLDAASDWYSIGRSLLVWV